MDQPAPGSRAARRRGETPSPADAAPLPLAIRLTAALVVLAGAAAWFHPNAIASDLWWHLANGRDVLARGAVPQTDIYSYTFGGRPSLMPEWLWAVVFWKLYGLGPQVVAWVNLGVLLLVYGLAYAHAARVSGSILGAAAAIWLAAAGAHWFVDIRPHVFTLLFLATFLLTRDRAWAPWLWPPLVVLWVNVHGGFAYGVGAIGLYVLVRIAERRLREGRWVIEWGPVASAALCVLAMLANPFGPRLLDLPLGFLDSGSIYRTVVEWMPTPFSLNLHSYAGRFWWTVALATAGTPFLVRRDPYIPLLALVTCAMAMSARRFIPMFAIAAAPLVATLIGTGRAWLGRRWPALDTPRAAAVAIAAGLIAAGGAWQDVRVYPRLFERWTEADMFPDAALRYLSALDGPERVLVEYQWAGYVMFETPDKKVFIDGRANFVYDDQIYRDYLAIEAGRTQLLAKYGGADAALFMSGSGAANALARPPANWRVVYTDPLATVLLPPDSPALANLPHWSTVLEGHTETAMIQAAAARRSGDLDGAIHHLRRAIAADPLLGRAYMKLAEIHAQRGDLDAVGRVMEESLRANPRPRVWHRNHEARLYERAGDWARARDAYAKAIPGGPNVEAAGFEAAVQRMDAKLGL